MILVPRLPALALFLMAFGCDPESDADDTAAPEDSHVGDSDTDTDADSDTDADADTDADTDTGPVDADGDGWTLADGDCDDSDPSVYPGAAEIRDDGIDQDCDGEDMGPYTRYTGTFELGGDNIVKLIGEEEANGAGWSVSGAGDVNGDGYDDVFVGAPWNGEGGNQAGASYLLHGPILADRDLSLADAKIVGGDSGDVAGKIVSGAGDVNNDGFADLLIGSSPDSYGATYLEDNSSPKNQMSRGRQSRRAVLFQEHVKLVMRTLNRSFLGESGYTGSGSETQPEP